MRVGVKASMSPSLSTEHQESTMSPWWKIYPINPVNFGQSPTTQRSMQSPHHTNTEVAASPTTNWYSPVEMTRVP